MSHLRVVSAAIHGFMMLLVFGFVAWLVLFQVVPSFAGGAGEILETKVSLIEKATP